MKILRINSINGPPGGVEQYINRTNECLKKTGNEITTIEINSTKIPGTLNDTISIYVDGRKMRRLFNDISCDKSVYEVLTETHRKINPDIIHIHHFRVAFMSIVKFIKSVKTPCVYTAHDAQLVCPISTLVLPSGKICEGDIKPRCMFTGCKVGTHVPYEMLRVKAFKHYLKDRIFAYICPSENMKQYMENYGFKPSYFIKSHPNLDTKSFQMYDFPSNNSIGYVGRIDRYKGLQILIIALKKIKEFFPDINLKIAGTGDYIDQVKKLAVELGVSGNVEFLGYLKRENHKVFFSSVNFTIIPSLMMENIIFTAQEAFSYGRPVIASAVGGIPEIVRHGYNGFLVRPYDSQELADKILFLLNHKDILLKFGENAVETIRLFTDNDNTCNDILTIYNKVLIQSQKMDKLLEHI